MNYIDNHIASRFEDFLQSWQKSTSEELQNYFDVYRKRIGKSGSNNKNRPYWIHLPQWTLTSFKANHKLNTIDKRFLKEIAWAQYCLFLAVRMHDDLYDGQTNCKSLIYAGDQLLVESGKIFSKYFPLSSVFWKYYYNLIEHTIRSIITVDILQRSHTTSLSKLLDCYSDVCSIFKIGTLAVCCKTNRMTAYKNISRLIDRLSIVSHMIDDLKDISEDYADGRFNSANIFLLNKGIRVNKQLKKSQGQSPRNLLTVERGMQFIDKIRAQIPSSYKSMQRINIPELKKYYTLVEDRINNLEKYFYLQTMNDIFNSE